jgi:hypothetical protein
MDPKELAKILTVAREKLVKKEPAGSVVGINLLPNGGVTVYVMPPETGESFAACVFHSLEEFATEFLIPY